MTMSAGGAQTQRLGDGQAGAGHLLPLCRRRGAHCGKCYFPTHFDRTQALFCRYVAGFH